MVKIPANLHLVDSRRAGGCQKPSCETSGTLHRHHKRHQAMWLGIWAGRRKSEQKWLQFIDSYYQFRPSDCVILCPNHHAEIHKIYDSMIMADKLRTRRPLSKYSWQQAEALMDKLEAACDEWLKHVTPGINSEQYGRKRRYK